MKKTEKVWQEVDWGNHLDHPRCNDCDCSLKTRNTNGKIVKTKCPNCGKEHRYWSTIYYVTYEEVDADQKLIASNRNM